MNRIRELREARNLNMREVAKALNLPYTTYVNYEKGTREPNSEVLIAIADFFNVTVDYLIGRMYEQAIHFNGVHIFRATGDDRVDGLMAHMDLEDYEIIYRAPGIAIAVDHDTPMSQEAIDYIVETYRIDVLGNKKSPANNSERAMPRELIKTALWGDCAYIDDRDLDDVLQYAEFIKERKKPKHLSDSQSGS